MIPRRIWFISLFLVIIFFIPGKELIAGKNKTSHLSINAQKVKVLYDQLQGFKNNPEFHNVGFGRCCRFYKWMKKVENLDLGKGGGIAIVKEIGIVPGELITLGMNYMKNQGHSNSYTRNMEATILSGFKPYPTLKKGQGVAITTDRTCINMNFWVKWIEALERKDYAAATLEDPECPRVYWKTVVTGPLAKETTSLGTFYQVMLPYGKKVWMGDTQVRFKGKK